jgi:hypothetical protein
MAPAAPWRLTTRLTRAAFGFSSSRRSLVARHRGFTCRPGSAALGEEPSARRFFPRPFFALSANAFRRLNDDPCSAYGRGHGLWPGVTPGGLSRARTGLRGSVSCGVLAAAAILDVRRILLGWGGGARRLRPSTLTRTTQSRDALRAHSCAAPAAVAGFAFVRPGPSCSCSPADAAVRGRPQRSEGSPSQATVSTGHLRRRMEASDRVLLARRVNLTRGPSWAVSVSSWASRPARLRADPRPGRFFSRTWRDRRHLRAAFVASSVVLMAGKRSYTGVSQRQLVPFACPSGGTLDLDQALEAARAPWRRFFWRRRPSRRADNFLSAVRAGFFRQSSAASPTPLPSMPDRERRTSSTPSTSIRIPAPAAPRSCNGPVLLAAAPNPPQYIPLPVRRLPRRRSARHSATADIRIAPGSLRAAPGARPLPRATSALQTPPPAAQCGPVLPRCWQPGEAGRCPLRIVTEISVAGTGSRAPRCPCRARSRGASRRRTARRRC